MKQNELISTLSALHQELSAADQIDPQALKMLQALTDDIARLSGEEKSLTDAEAEPVTSGLKDLMLKFESEYPQLSAAVGKVADALASIGI